MAKIDASHYDNNDDGTFAQQSIIVAGAVAALVVGLVVLGFWIVVASVG
jgi:hypothetical protein